MKYITVLYLKDFRKFMSKLHDIFEHPCLDEVNINDLFLERLNNDINDLCVLIFDINNDTIKTDTFSNLKKYMDGHEELVNNNEFINIFEIMYSESMHTNMSKLLKGIFNLVEIE